MHVLAGEKVRRGRVHTLLGVALHQSLLHYHLWIWGVHVRAPGVFFEKLGPDLNYAVSHVGSSI